MKKKITLTINKIFGLGITLSLLLGGISVLFFIISLIIGGDLGKEIALFTKNTYFKFLIGVASFCIMLGLFSMYLNNESALSLKADKEEAEQELRKAEEKLEKNNFERM